MTIKQLAREICRREKLKKQVDIAQVNEILGHLSDILFSEAIDEKEWCLKTYMSFIKNGEKRAKRGKR